MSSEPLIDSGERIAAIREAQPHHEAKREALGYYPLTKAAKKKAVQQGKPFKEILKEEIKLEEENNG